MMATVDFGPVPAAAVVLLVISPLGGRPGPDAADPPARFGGRGRRGVRS
ncbi:MAG: hypothetical protein AVDCRST_MAG41-1836 [uncultured Corynebacteriales bacterium]|uniref:Uncharacterized protein n=1 Tax=uncultured Mycobacteriales bacterium TaxID=581187 RepID=A0A6J4IFC8_9ACTN|nr:MAG: hypothetical protein AVDCRST_MAG41-1836 [uncultured Corynebacteriales bacterium]